jgi:hypothetical protein
MGAKHKFQEIFYEAELSAKPYRHLRGGHKLLPDIDPHVGGGVSMTDLTSDEPSQVRLKSI